MEKEEKEQIGFKTLKVEPRITHNWRKLIFLEVEPIKVKKYFRFFNVVNLNIIIIVTIVIFNFLSGIFF